MKDVLTIEGIKQILDYPLEIEILDCVDSTNDYLKRLAKDQFVDNKVAIAQKQTNGKGRRGRSFYSPDESGLYMSLLIRPDSLSLSSATKITTMAALAACYAIETVTQKQSYIKWVNDILIDDKKVAGILTEATVNFETKLVDYLVVGIGFNVYEPSEGFPTEIAQIAGSILEKQQPSIKNKLCGQFLNEFLKLFNHPQLFSYQEYRERSYVIGKEIVVHALDKQRVALAIDIDKDCHLIVEYSDQSKEVLSSGEISVRKL